MHFSDMGCPTSHCIKWDAAVAGGNGVYENENPLQGLTLKGPTWPNRNSCTQSRIENGCYKDGERMKILGYMLAITRNQTGASFARARNHNHNATHQWCVRSYCYFYIPTWDEDAVKLSSKVTDKNGRENQTKTSWMWSGRHWDDMGCGKRKWWEKVLWWG